MDDWEQLRSDMAEGHLSQEEKALIDRLEKRHKDMEAKLSETNKIKETMVGDSMTFGEWLASLFPNKPQQLCENCKANPGTICMNCFQGLTMQIKKLNEDNAALLKQVEEEKLEDKKDELEDYWNNKRPKSDVVYKARPCHKDKSTANWYAKNIPVDPKVFWTLDNSLPKFKGSFDSIASQCLDWVAKNIKYTTDEEGEFWQFAFETLFRKKGDCEDGAILMANMMLVSGVPYWRIRLNAGDVKGGGHAYVTYLREADNKWYILDWCYWYNESKNFKRSFHDAEKYFSIWFSWNTKYLYKNEEYDR